MTAHMTGAIQMFPNHISEIIRNIQTFGWCQSYTDQKLGSLQLHIGNTAKIKALLPHPKYELKLNLKVEL